MSGTLSIFHQPTLVVDGENIDLPGSLINSVKGEQATVCETYTNVIRKRVRVPAESQVVAWLWAETGGFAYLEIRPVAPPGSAAEGFVQIGLRYNAPTASDDLTPTGSINHWKDLSKSCVGVFSLDSERSYIHATAANAVAQSGSGTYPGVWGEGAKVNGVCDAIALRNDAEDDVYVDLLIVPK